MHTRVAVCALLLAACQTAAAVGTTCTRPSDCASNTCEFGRCRVGCRNDRDCTDGARCFISADDVGACSLDIDLGCESGVGRVCASGLVCVADRCEQTCMDRGDCPSDADCRETLAGGVSICVDTLEELDGGTPDAAADAGTSCAITDMCFESSGAACAVDCMGRVWCWGEEHGGGLGIGEDATRVVTTPSAVLDVMGVAIAGVDSLACAEGFACVHVGGDAARHTGHVLCWGYEATQNIPVSTSASAADLSTPVVGDAITVAASYHHACMLDGSDGSLRCFGINDAVIAPMMPAATTFQPPTAPLGGALGPVASIHVSANGACAVLRSGSVECWGENDFGQAGHSPIEATTHATEPNVGATTISGASGPLTGVAMLALGLKHAAVLVDAGGSGSLALMTWGGNDFGELGETLDWVGDACDDVLSVGDVCRSVAATPSNAPTLLAIASDGTAMASCGIEAGTHHVLCWGNNLHGIAGTNGDNVLLARGLPVLRDSDHGPLDDAQHVFVGAQNACATRSDGALWCWGANADGTLARPADDADHLAVPIVFPF